MNSNEILFHYHKIKIIYHNIYDIIYLCISSIQSLFGVILCLPAFIISHVMLFCLDRMKLQKFDNILSVLIYISLLLIMIVFTIPFIISSVILCCYLTITQSLYD